MERSACYVENRNRVCENLKTDRYRSGHDRAGREGKDEIETKTCVSRKSEPKETYKGGSKNVRNVVDL
jgi:hypothetical protein